MTTTYTLTPTQITQYHTDGYLVLRASEHRLVDPSVLQHWTNEVRSWPNNTVGKWMPYEEINSLGQRQLLRTEKFVDYHPAFHAFLCGERMAHLLKQLSYDEDMLLFKDKINYKLANGNGFAAHLDAPAYDHIGNIQHLTANLAVDNATADNGCLEVVRASHKMTVPCSHGGHIEAEWEASQEWISVPLAPGDMLLFGSYLAHRSGANRTQRSRSMVYATYALARDGRDLRERYYEDRRRRFPPEHERVEGVDYSEGWKRYAFAAPFSSQGIGAGREGVEVV